MKTRTLIVSILGVLVVSSASPAQNAEAPKQEPQKPVFRQSDSPTPAQPKPLFAAKTVPTPATQAPRSSRRLNPTPVARTPGVRSTLPSMSPKELRIFELRHISAEEMVNLIISVFRIEAHQDYRLNRVIVNVTQEQMESIENLIQAMDVADSEASTPRDTQNLVYRIYMFEIPSGDRCKKPFSMILRTSTHVTSP